MWCQKKERSPETIAKPLRSNLATYFANKVTNQDTPVSASPICSSSALRQFEKYGTVKYSANLLFKKSDALTNNCNPLSTIFAIYFEQRLCQDGPKWRQDVLRRGQEGVKMDHDGVKMAQDGAKMGQNVAKMVSDGGKMASRWIMMAPRWPKIVPRWATMAPR